MGWVFDSEEGVKRVSDEALRHTIIPPASFRGIDCAVLAARYIVYRRNAGLDQRRENPDEITVRSAPGVPETASRD